MIFWLLLISALPGMKYIKEDKHSIVVSLPFSGCNRLSIRSPTDMSKPFYACLF